MDREETLSRLADLIENRTSEHVHCSKRMVLDTSDRKSKKES